MVDQYIDIRQYIPSPGSFLYIDFGRYIVYHILARAVAGAHPQPYGLSLETMETMMKAHLSLATRNLPATVRRRQTYFVHEELVERSGACACCRAA
jgi:hypothetical protein